VKTHFYGVTAGLQERETLSKKIKNGEFLKNSRTEAASFLRNTNNTV
jgi:hypothetical protein